MSTVSTIKMTARQFLELGEDPVGVRLELVNGEVAVSPSPTPNHSFADSMLRRLLIEYVEQNDLGQVFGDVDTVFGEHDVRRPDVIFFSKGRLHLVSKTAMEGPPDLCVEILSPSSVKTDRADKFELYRAGGVANYWIVDLEQKTIEGYRLEDGLYALAGRGQGDDVVHLPPFVELGIPLGRLWRPK